MQTEFEPHCFYFKNNKTKVEFGVRRDQISLKGLLPSLTACLVGALQAHRERPAESCEGVNGLRKSRENGEPALSTLPSQVPVAVSEQSPEGPWTASLSSGHPPQLACCAVGVPRAAEKREAGEISITGVWALTAGALEPQAPAPWDPAGQHAPPSSRSQGLLCLAPHSLSPPLLPFPSLHTRTPPWATCFLLLPVQLLRPERTLEIKYIRMPLDSFSTTE